MDSRAAVHLSIRLFSLMITEKNDMVLFLTDCYNEYSKGIKL